MRSRFVIAIALLSTCLTAGTCEFRASSNTGIRPPPSENPTPREGLVVHVSVGDSGGSSTTASTTSISQAAFATSVLSSRAFDPPAPPESMKFEPGFDETFATVAVADDDSFSNAVPEPSAVWLFGTGLLLIGARIQRLRTASLRG